MRKAFVIVVLVTILALGMAYQFKDRCNDGPWRADSWIKLCYSDTAWLYNARHLDRDVLPYFRHDLDNTNNPDLTQRQGFNEYPVLTGMLMYGAALAGTARTSLFGGEESQGEFFAWQALFLSLFAVGTVLLLLRMASDRSRVVYVAAGAPLVLYAFHNYDLMPVFFTVLGLYWWERHRLAASGIAFGLGAASKLYPLLALPLLFVLLVRRGYDAQAPNAGLRALGRAVFRNGDAWDFVVGFVGAFVVLNAPLIIFGDRQVWLGTFQFHLERSLNHESLWSALAFLGRDMDWPVLGNVSDEAMRSFADAWVPVLYGGIYLLLVVAAWRGRLGARAAVFAPILAFLVVAKFLSVQYALWILPMFALLPLPFWSYLAFAATDIMTNLTMFNWISWNVRGGAPGPDYHAYTKWMFTWVLVRALVFFALLAILLRNPHIARPEMKRPVKAPGPRRLDEFRWWGAGWVTMGLLLILASYLAAAWEVDPPYMYQAQFPPLLLMAAPIPLAVGAVALLRLAAAAANDSTSSTHPTPQPGPADPA